VHAQLLMVMAARADGGCLVAAGLFIYARLARHV